MTDRPSHAAHARAILVLGLPLVGSHLAQMMLHVVDTLMLGWYSVEALAAGVLGASTFFIVFFLGNGFAQAVMPMVATAIGQRDEAQVRRVTRMGLWLSVLYSIVIYPFFWFAEPILLALGQDPVVSALTRDYLRIAGLGLAPALLVMVLKSYLAALERTQVVLWVTVAAVGLNVAVNWALIFGNWGAPELGVVGAAWASVLVQSVTLLALAAYAGMLPDLRRFSLFQRLWRPDWQAFMQVFRLGWPIGLTALAEGGLFHAAAIMMGWIGTIELAAHGIALEIAAIAFMIHMGLSNAATVRTGRFDGMGAAGALRDGARVALGLSLVVALGIVTLFLTVPAVIIGLFLDPINPRTPEIVAYGTMLLAVAALFQVADAAQVMALGLLRGLRDTRVPLLLAALSYWLIGVPTSYLLAFPLGLGGAGLWLGLVVGLTLAGTLLLTRFWRRAPRAP